MKFNPSMPNQKMAVSSITNLKSIKLDLAINFIIIIIKVKWYFHKFSH